MSRHPLDEVFQDAVFQASSGKGNERHGKGVAFYSQPWVTISRSVGVSFLEGQAIKKLLEASGNKETFSKDHWEREVLGAINYMAMAVLYRRHFEEKKDGISSLSKDTPPF